VVAVVFILGVGYAATKTPLMEASEKDDTEEVQALLAKGADVNAKALFGITALKLAKEKGHKEIVRILKEARTKEGGDVYILWFRRLGENYNLLLY